MAAASSSSASATAPPSAERAFYRVDGRTPDKMKALAAIFHRILTPLYGPQEKALTQIREGKDRACYLLYEEKTPVAVLVFKTGLSDEFREFGVSRSVEVKSLFVDNARQNSGRGLGSALVDKLKREVARLGLSENGIHVTVSESKEESLAFFAKKGFGTRHTWSGRYRPGVKEHLLFCPAGAPTSDPITVARGADDPPELLHVVHNAHVDDIHCLLKLPDGTFVSGSKDNSIYKWRPSGELAGVVKEVEPTQQSRRDWITAMGVVNKAYFASGLRNGKIMLWRTDGTFAKEVNVRLPRRGHKSHEYNTRRVNCIATGLDPDRPSLFVGFPTMFDEYNLIEGRTCSSTRAHRNDWVYCIHPLTDRQLLTVTGCTLNLWNRSESGWEVGATLITEEARVRGRQRPFISSLAEMEGSDPLFSLALFDGSVRTLDIERSETVGRWSEHKGRVWKTVSLDATRFASGGEDRTIKIWDTRSERSVHTIIDPVGQVTSLLQLSETTLISGSCPEEAMVKGKGAQIRFYDTRKF